MKQYCDLDPWDCLHGNVIECAVNWFTEHTGSAGKSTDSSRHIAVTGPGACHKDFKDFSYTYLPIALM